MSVINRRDCLRMALGLGGALAMPASGQTVQWGERALNGFGTSLWLRVGHEDERRVELGLDTAVQTIRHVERQMSLFDVRSALCQLNREGVLRHADRDLLFVLRLSRRIAAHSAGAFDFTIQPLWNVWAAAQREGRLPDATEVRDARSLVGWQRVAIGEKDIALNHPGMAISLNGIAQGYAADLVRARLQAQGIEHALLDTGEWAPMGHGPQGAPWALALEGVPSQLLTLVSDGRAMATSSDAHSAFSADRRHHHILDPRTGYSPTSWASVTVAAPSCALADGLTKVIFMQSASSAVVIARQWGVDVLLIDKAGRWQASSGMPLRSAPTAA